MKLRVQPPKTWQFGSLPDRKYLPTTTCPSGETATASVLVPMTGVVARIWKLDATAACVIEIKPPSPSAPPNNDPPYDARSTATRIRHSPPNRIPGRSFMDHPPSFLRLCHQTGCRPRRVR